MTKSTSNGMFIDSVEGDVISIPRTLRMKDTLINDSLDIGVVVMRGKVCSILDNHTLTVVTKLIKWTGRDKGTVNVARRNAILRRNVVQDGRVPFQFIG